MNDPAVSIATVVELIGKAKSDAEHLAEQIRKAQHDRGYALDTRADYAEGSAAAYAYTLSVIAGAFGVPDAGELLIPSLTEVRDQLEASIVAAKLGPVIEHDPVNDQVDSIVASHWPVDHAEGE